ncbi:MAG: hypothetical protein DME69_08005 [Verrucomicrobia bacterium]|nr:MAG: hypothetical protein DME69_08005 [Verrucomicrobiota bacterium]
MEICEGCAKSFSVDANFCPDCWRTDRRGNFVFGRRLFWLCVAARGNLLDVRDLMRREEKK